MDRNIVASELLKLAKELVAVGRRASPLQLYYYDFHDYFLCQVGVIVRGSITLKDLEAAGVPVLNVVKIQPKTIKRYFDQMGGFDEEVTTDNGKGLSEGLRVEPLSGDNMLLSCRFQIGGQRGHGSWHKMVGDHLKKLGYEEK